jgi:hypothetical protein
MVKNMIGQKIHVKAWNFECEMNFQWVKWQFFLINFLNQFFLNQKGLMYFNFTRLNWNFPFKILKFWHYYVIFFNPNVNFCMWQK